MSRREAVMSNVRSAARNEGPSGVYPGSSAGVISNPPQTYASNATTSGNRYATTYSQTQQQSPSAFDSVDRRTDIGNMFVPMQPDQYSSYPTGPASTTRHVAVPAQTVAPSFYGAGVVPAGQAPSAQQQRSNPFSVPESLTPMSGGKETRRGGMDSWQR